MAVIFELREYALAETAFVRSAVHALTRARDGLYGQMHVEPSSRLGTTQITTEQGVVVEQEPVQVRFHITLDPDELIDGRLDAFLASLDAAADELLDGFMPQFYEYLARITEATGNVVDAKDRPFFDSMYEMFEKVDLQFDEEGRITQSLVINPADAKKWEKGAADLTPEQRRQLDELIERKRAEFHARRRDRRLPRLR